MVLTETGCGSGGGAPVGRRRRAAGRTAGPGPARPSGEVTASAFSLTAPRFRAAGLPVTGRRHATGRSPQALCHSTAGWPVQRTRKPGTADGKVLPYLPLLAAR